MSDQVSQSTYPCEIRLFRDAGGCDDDEGGSVRNTRLRTFFMHSVITTDPNPLTDYIHNTKHRIPAILFAGDEDSWDPGMGKMDIEGVLRAFSVGGMGACIIDRIQHQA